MKKVIYIIFISIVSSIILINIFSMCNLSLFGYRSFKIASGSMRPKYNVNDLIIVKKNANYKVGDVITFKNKDGEYVTHRIIEIDDKYFTAKGDYNNTIDSKISNKNIVGKVVYKSRLLKIVNLVFNSVLFWIITPIVIFIMVFIPRKENDIKE